MKEVLLSLIQSYAMLYGVDPNVAITVAELESNMRPNTIGITGDVGLFQLNPSSFPTYTVDQLLDPNTNIELGVRYLARLHTSCTYKDELNWLVCWNAGPAYAKRIRHPEKFPYVVKARQRMALRVALGGQ